MIIHDTTPESKEEFCSQFIEHMVRLAGETFDDGQPVREYAAQAAEAYWCDKDIRDEGPEACVLADMDYWGE